MKNEFKPTMRYDSLFDLMERVRMWAPTGCRIDLDNINGDIRDVIHVYVFGFKTYEDGCTFLRTLGFGEWEKHPQSDGQTVIHADTEQVWFRIHCATLPPTCRIERKLVRRPKVQHVSTRTEVEGEFVEEFENQVVCDGGADKAKQATVKSENQI